MAGAVLALGAALSLFACHKVEAPQPSAFKAPHSVGIEGVAAFDKLSAQDITALKDTKVFFAHKSVGASLVEGAKTLGFDFASAQNGSAYAGVKLGETMLRAKNKDPEGKLNDFAHFMIDDGIGPQVQLAGTKLCYVDFNPKTNLESLEATYTAKMQEIRAKNPAVRLFHVTPPIETSRAWKFDDINAKRLQFGQWLKKTYGENDVVYDLQEVVSTGSDGKLCIAKDVPVLCDSWAADDEGHLNPAGAARAAKGLLYALHQARTLK